MPDAGFFDPLPTGVAPQGAFPVAAGIDEFEEVLVGYVVPVDGKLRDECGVAAKFIVPTEGGGFRGLAQRCAAGRDSDAMRRSLRAVKTICACSQFQTMVEPVNHVGKRFS